MIMKIDLQSRLCTNAVPVTQSFEQPSFKNKNNIFWNGFVNNPSIKQQEGILLTSGKGLTVQPYSKGAILKTEDNRTYTMQFENILHTKQIPIKSAGEVINHAYYDNKMFTLYKNNETISLVIQKDDYIEQIDYPENIKSAVFSSVYNVDEIPVLFLVDTKETSTDVYENQIRGYKLDNLDEHFLEHNTKDYIPLGDADSATIRKVNGNTMWILGCDDIDKNRAKTFKWSTNLKRAEEVKWFGCISPRGDITGEPIPDPSMLPEPQRRDNGIYTWEVWDAQNKKYREWDLIGGYFVNEATGKYEPIKIEKSRGGIAGSGVTNATMLRVNISVNDKKNDESDKEWDPMQYYISNYADSRTVYYDYGPGWLKCYVRLSTTIVPGATSGDGFIEKMYIFTFGAKTDNFLNSGLLPGRVRRESLMATGKTKRWDYSYGKLNTRIYHVGDTNVGTRSILGSIPFTVEITQPINNKRALDMQMFKLLPLSFSYSKSLISTASTENAIRFTLYESDLYTTLIANNMILNIEHIKDYDDAYKKVYIDKIGDYNYRTNVLDCDNLIKEDRFGNITLIRGFIPYNMDAILKIEDLKLEPPKKDETDSNEIFYWSAGTNMQLTEGPAASYMLPVIMLSLFIDSSQKEQFIKEVIDNRGSPLRPILKGLFDDYEEIDIYYTLSTVSTTVYYRTTNVVKVSDKNDYGIYGKATYDLLKEGTFYWPASSSVSVILMPVAVGSIVNGVNYITPTVELADDYACRLYTQNNQLMIMYNYSQQIYYGNQIFTIYGYNYYYDGQGIYYLGSQNNYDSNQFVCYALGLTFLANNGSEAYFYSDWEKRLFIFTGSNTIAAADSLTNIGRVVDALFSSKEQILYMLTDDNKLILRSQTDTAAIENIPSGSKLIGTNKGCGIIYKENNVDKYQLFSPRLVDDFDCRELVLGTEYLGLEGKNLRCNHVDFLLYKINDNPAKIEIEVHTLAGVEDKIEKQTIIVNNKDWKGTGMRLRITPRVNIGNAFRAQIKSKDHIAVSALSFDIDDLNKNTSASRSAKRL